MGVLYQYWYGVSTTINLIGRSLAKTYHRIVMPGVWRASLAVALDFAFVIQSLCS